ncbi:transposase [Kitasatospora purpeofusca]|uniref:transposase n=1 Tax=Kitasatospora purpeofusca TaxID=67352 RepID=UPI0035E35D0D
MLISGCDWSDRWLDFVVVGQGGAVLAERRIVYADSPDPVAEYQGFLASLDRRWRGTVTGIEDPNVLFARALLNAGMTVVHVDPARAARHRGVVGGPKTDRADAALIADLVRQGVCRPVIEASAGAQALRVVTLAHRHAVDARMQTAHALRAALMKIWPAAVSAWPSTRGGLSTPQALAVMTAAPGPRAAQALTRARLADILTQAGRTRAVTAEAERLHLHFRRPAMLLDPRIEDGESVRIRHLVHTLAGTVAQASALEGEMLTHYRRQHHHSLTAAIPGIGHILGAYLLAEIGDRPVERYGSGRALAAYAGVAPTTWASGVVVRVSVRRAAATYLQRTLHTAAFSLCSHSPGAQAYYQKRRDAGDTHRTALRKVARRLVLCLYHCMVAGADYDDAIAFGYTADSPEAPALRRRQPPLNEEQIRLALAMLSAPGGTVTGTARALKVSGQTIYRHVLGTRER